MVVAQGDVYWADLPEPIGSEAGFRRPVIVVQGDRFNRSNLRTVICIPMSTNLRLAAMPGNVRLPMPRTGLPRDSVAVVSQILTIDRGRLGDQAGRLTQRDLDRLFQGLDLVLGR